MTDNPLKQTPLFEQHRAMGAKLVDFGGWFMPVNYGSQLEEHYIVRRDAGMFDVCHMTVVDLLGSDVTSYLATLLANDFSKVSGQPGKAMYSCMLNQQGGVIDDLIVYAMDDNWVRMVVNAATREKDIAWMKAQLGPNAVEVKEREDLAMIAVQGPNSRAKASQALGELIQGAEKLKPFNARVFNQGTENELFVARTGYTGEDGYEIIVPAEQAVSSWKKLFSAGVRPCGLGARDTLRLEAGMNLYGSDMDETVSPLESGLAWTVDFSDTRRDFIGRKALELQKENGLQYKLVGLILRDKGVLRAHQKVIVEGRGEGELTSGSFSPTLQKSIGFARVPLGTKDSCKVEIRKKLLNASVVKLPFVRQGKILV